MKSIVLLSGGLDSTVLARQLQAEGDEVIGLSIHYGQRHDRELSHALHVCEALNIMHHRIALPSQIFLGAESSQVGLKTSVPHGHYAAENMRQTIVPNRNMLLLSTAVAVAISQQAEIIAYAAHAGDHAVYPDCRPDFVMAMQGAIARCDWNPPKLRTPFISMMKHDIVRLGAANGAPLHLSYSCYEGKDYHCGQCGTCVERKEAFELAGVIDPTIYVG